MSTRRSRLARRLGFDRNPLRRRVDRIELAFILAVITVFLTVTPVLAATAGQWARSAAARPDRADRAWRQVPAIVVRSTALPDRAWAAADIGWATARWTAPNGQPRTGLIPVLAGARAGTSVLIWEDGAGWPTASPPRRGLQQGQVSVAESLTWYALAIVTLLILEAGRSLFARHRLEAWDKEWRAIGPRWSRQP
jgi:hypothetical protein